MPLPHFLTFQSHKTWIRVTMIKDKVHYCRCDIAWFVVKWESRQNYAQVLT
uniref:Uncharacterized protein n=1 Tax=Anguilla anguilla TaxID=7936 RepID=A0A0E9WNA8_ANGAN